MLGNNIFRGLRVKKPPMNKQKYLKEGFSLVFGFMLTFHSTGLKAFSAVILRALTLV